MHPFGATSILPMQHVQSLHQVQPAPTQQIPQQVLSQHPTIVQGWQGNAQQPPAYIAPVQMGIHVGQPMGIAAMQQGTATQTQPWADAQQGTQVRQSPTAICSKATFTCSQRDSTVQRAAMCNTCPPTFRVGNLPSYSLHHSKQRTIRSTCLPTFRVGNLLSYSQRHGKQRSKQHNIRWHKRMPSIWLTSQQDKQFSVLAAAASRHIRHLHRPSNRWRKTCLWRQDDS